MDVALLSLRKKKHRIPLIVRVADPGDSFPVALFPLPGIWIILTICCVCNLRGIEPLEQDRSLSVVAGIAVGPGDEDYVENCLLQLLADGIRYVILDDTGGQWLERLIGKPPYCNSLLGYRRLDPSPVYSLTTQLQAKQEMFNALACDWVIHLDVDEVMHSFIEGETLLHAIERLDRDGVNVINFDEFVFLPLTSDYQPGLGAPQPITHYYYFRPAELRLMRAFKHGEGLSNIGTSGHRVEGTEVRIAPENLALRHYIFRNQRHAREKYTSRRFCEQELRRGWHGNRCGYGPANFDFPEPNLLETLEHPASRNLNREKPRQRHYWQWGSAR